MLKTDKVLRFFASSIKSAQVMRKAPWMYVSFCFYPQWTVKVKWIIVFMLDDTLLRSVLHCSPPPCFLLSVLQQPKALLGSGGEHQNGDWWRCPHWALARETNTSGQSQHQGTGVQNRCGGGPGDGTEVSGNIVYWWGLEAAWSTADWRRESQEIVIIAGDIVTFLWLGCVVAQLWWKSFCMYFVCACVCVRVYLLYVCINACVCVCVNWE